MIWLRRERCTRVPLVNQQFSYVRLAEPLPDLAGISVEFSEAITTQFCFTCTLQGVIAMPLRRHARLCNEFLLFGSTSYKYN